MKIARFVLFCFVLSFGLTAILWAQSEPPAVAPQNETVSARLISFEGIVLVQPQPQERWIPAEEDMLLASGARLKTNPGSSAQIAFENSVAFQAEVGEDSEVAIEDLGSDKRMFLNKGHVYTEVEGLAAGDSFEVKTPSAVCGVRGTAWEVEFKEDETSVDTFEHEVYVQGLDKKGKPFGDRVFVKEGWATAVKRFQKPRPLFAVAQKRMERWQTLRGKMHERLENFRKTRPGRFKKLAEVQKRMKVRMADRFQNRKGEKGVSPVLKREGDKPLGPLRKGDQGAVAGKQDDSKSPFSFLRGKRDDSQPLLPFLKKKKDVQQPDSQDSAQTPLAAPKNRRSFLGGPGGKK